MTNDLLAQAWRCHQADDYAQAERLCRQVLQASAQNGEAWRLLGEACLFQQKHAEAAHGFEQAKLFGSESADSANNLGVALAQLGRRVDAIDCYRRSLQRRPGFVEASNNLAVALNDEGGHAEAEAVLREALRLRPDYAEAHNSLGIALAAQGKLNEAVSSYHRALQHRPNYPKAYNNLGIALAAQGKLDEAVRSYQQSLQLSPHSTDTGNNLAGALVQQGKLDEAVTQCHEALLADPNHAEAHNTLAVARLSQGKIDDAVAGYGQALQLKPEYAESHKNLAMALLLKGDFAAGWREYEWRWRCGDFPRLPYQQPRWDGSRLAGRTILLHAEQGLGDTLQFIRYATLVQRRGGRVVAACQKALVPILGSCPGIDELVSKEGSLPPFDVFAPLLSLPLLLCTTLATIPAETPYLRARDDLVALWRAELGSLRGFRIGIAWQGNPTHRQDRFRSFSLAHFEALSRIPGVRLVSLQKGHGTEQLRDRAGRFPVVDLGDLLDVGTGPFLDTAAVMKNLDLVVTSDSAVAHLAGALGVPVWVALPFAPDWRWLLDREDSPWYPSMRLFRQPAFGDWDSVFRRISAALEEQVAASVGARPLTVEIAPGELLDKITILQIKSERITDEAKLRHVRHELGQLMAVRESALPRSPELDTLITGLKEINEKLWVIEDDIRRCERDHDFGPRFVALARSVYHTNDERSAFKRRINDLLGSSLVEEKEYSRYAVGT